VCPALFRNDCVGWLSEVQAALPSVVLAAKDPAGQDVIDVRVFVDGSPFVDTLNGIAHDVDPGPHVFRFEWAGHGSVEQSAVIREGEKDRTIVASFGASALPPPAKPRQAHVPAGVWVLGGVALLGLGGYPALFVTADSNLNGLRATCGRTHTCNSSQVDGVTIPEALAYVSLGVGIAAAGAAVTWYFVSRPSGETAALSLEPTAGGGTVSWRVRF
jgi:hypothetical protein